MLRSASALRVWPCGRHSPLAASANIFARTAIKLPHRRQFLYLAAGVAALPAASRIAWAQSYPSRPVHLLVGYARRWHGRHGRHGWYGLLSPPSTEDDEGPGFIPGLSFRATPWRALNETLEIVRIAMPQSRQTSVACSP
jgi:hypothetical protein